MTRHLPYLFLAALASAFASCSSEDTCFTERDCPSGTRCEVLRAGDEGLCVACGDTEIPYNGIDDDCDPTTRDLDLDRDGDNWVNSPFMPGGDCDDNDPTVSSRLPEVCDDGKDNNCKNGVDEPECRDVAAPTVRIEAPAANSVHSGTVRFTVFAEDDYQLTRVELRQGERQYTEVAASGSLRYFDVDTTQLTPDGVFSFQAIAVDTQERSSTDSLSIRVDNFSPPDIEFTSPAPGRSYGGQLLVDATATDGSGVARMAALIDGVVVGEVQSGQLQISVGTSTLAEGAHTFEIEAEDNAGNVIRDGLVIFVDRSGPNIEFDPPPGTSLSGAAVVTVTATDTAGIRSIVCEGQTYPSNPADCALNTLFLPNGSYTVTATVYDGTIIDGAETGNVGVARVTYDIFNEVNRPPVLRFIDPADGHGVYRNTLIRTEVFSPNGIDRVELLVDGEPAGARQTPPFEFEFDFSRMTGTAELELVAYDTSANQSSTTATVLVVPPPRLRVADEVRVPAGGTTENYLMVEITGDDYPDLLLTTPDLLLYPGTETPLVYGLPVILGPSGKDLRAVDLDGDTDLDLIVFTGTGITLYFNDGSGTFTPGATYNPTITALSVFDVGDLDGDGRVDVVFGHAAAGLADFIVMRQNASGQFVQGGTFGLVGEVTSIHIGPADDDGDLDVLIGRVRTNFVSVFLNGGTGSFGAGQDSATADRPRTARFTELTGDNYPDLIIGGEAGRGSIQVLSGNPQAPGQFSGGQLIRLMDDPSGFALGDWNGDNLPDLVITLPIGNQIQVHENTGGSFGPKRNYAIARDVMRPIIFDVDRDGLPDLVMQSPYRTSLAVARNRGTPALPWRFGAAPLLPIDFVQNLRNCPYGPFDPERVPGAVEVGQLVGGPLVDLAFAVDAVECDENPFDPDEVVDPIPPAVLVLENQGLGDFLTVSQTDLPDAMDASTLAIGDLDGLVGPDIAVGTRQSYDPMDMEAEPTAALLLADPMGGYVVNNLFISEPESVAIGDVNADGEGEVVYSQRPINSSNHGLIVYDASGSLVYSNRVGSGASSVVIGNFDADPNGDLDMAVANSESDNVSVHYWNPAQTSWRRSIYNTNASISALTAALLPGDDRPDLIGVGESGVIVLESDAAFGFRTPTAWNGGAPSEPYRISTGDFNRDGLLDVIVLNASQDGVALLVGRPQGGFFMPDQIPVTRGPQAFGLGQVWQAEDDLVVVNNVVPGLLFLLNETE